MNSPWPAPSFPSPYTPDGWDERQRSQTYPMPYGAAAPHGAQPVLASTIWPERNGSLPQPQPFPQSPPPASYTGEQWCTNPPHEPSSSYVQPSYGSSGATPHAYTSEPQSYAYQSDPQGSSYVYAPNPPSMSPPPFTANNNYNTPPQPPTSPPMPQQYQHAQGSDHSLGNGFNGRLRRGLQAVSAFADGVNNHYGGEHNTGAYQTELPGSYEDRAPPTTTAAGVQYITKPKPTSNPATGQRWL